MSDFLNRTLDNLRSGPLGPLVRWIEAHPRLSAWIVLALGMVILLVIEARDVGLLPGQWVALIVATILVAGACIWIVSWEDKDSGAEEPAPEEKPSQRPKRRKTQ
jgi:MFS superfamily sulfate permease-like transporter